MNINLGGFIMTQEQGNLAINSENIFPIIKKWLYSDHDIFLREVVSTVIFIGSQICLLEYK